MLVGAVLILCLPQTGKLQLYDLASGNLLETIDAHDGALWSLSLSPDQVTNHMLGSGLEYFPVSYIRFYYCLTKISLGFL